MKRGHMNKKGLDAIVTTIIIILLALVAVGIIWVVVQRVADEGATQIGINSKCLAVDLKHVNSVAVSGEAGNYTVTLNRGAGTGESDAIGVKVNIFNATANGGVADFGTTLVPLDTKSAKIVGVTGANKIEFTPYFTDSSGTEQLCSNTGEDDI